MDAPTNDATILILGHSLWADTTQPPQPGYGLAVSVVAVTGQNQESRGKLGTESRSMI